MERLASLRAPRGRGAVRVVGAAVAVLTAVGALVPARALGAQAPAGAADTLELLVASTTDVHGRLRGWDYFASRPDTVRSLARAATVVDSLRTAHPGRVVLVDAGDLLQGTPMTYVAARVAPDQPHPVPAAMNAMRYDAAAIGNHEFNYGVPTLDRAVAQARFPFLAANVRRADGSRAYRAWTMVERGGAKVALIGGTTPGAMVWDRDNLAAAKLTIGDIVPAVREAAAEARAAGADVVVAVLHSGLDEPSTYDTTVARLPGENVSARIAREVRGVDVVVFGHSHRQLADTTIGGALVMQPKNWSESVGVARLQLVRAGARWTVAAKRGTLVPTIGRVESPAVLAATQAAHERAVSYAASVIGTTAVAWRADSSRVVDTPLLDFTLEVMRRAAKAQLAASAAFSLDASLDAGAVTVAEMARLYPYENTLRAVRVTGAQLRAFLEHGARYYQQADAATAGAVDRTVAGYNFDVIAGADYVLDLARPVGQRVTSLTFQGRPVADADTFTLALNNYRQTGGGGFSMLAGAPVVHDEGLEIRQLLIDEVKARGTLRPESYFTQNWRLAPPSAVATGYAAMRGDATGRGAASATTAGAVVTTERSTGAGRDAEAATPDTATVRVRKDGPLASPRAGAPTTLRIVAINDVHGAVEPRADTRGVRRGGLGPLAAAIARARAECRPPQCVSVLLDGGDEFQGTPASNLTYGRAVVPIMRELGVDASALGNHEFDWGVDTLRARMRELSYPVLGANVRTTDGAKLPWLREDTLVVRGGLRIGIVGVADPATPRSSKALNVKGLRFDPPAPVIDERARALRARGADLVIVTGHIGGYCDRDGENDPGAAAAGTPQPCTGEVFEMARAIREPIAAIVSGHTHSRIATVVNGVPIAQGRSSGRALGVIDVPLAGGAPHVEVREVVADSVGTVPPRVAALTARALSDVQARVAQVVGEVADAMPKEPDEQYALGNLIADAQRWATRADVAIMNNGGIRAGLPAGTATFGRLYEIQPFGNTLYKLTVRGSALKAYLPRLVAREKPRWHVSGLQLIYDTTRTGGERLVSATLAGGAAIEDDKLYSVTVNDFLVTGGDGLTLADGAASVVGTNVVDLDALIGYVRQLPQPARAAAEVRIRSVTEAAR